MLSRVVRKLTPAISRASLQQTIIRGFQNSTPSLAMLPLLNHLACDSHTRRPFSSLPSMFPSGIKICVVDFPERLAQNSMITMSTENLIRKQATQQLRGFATDKHKRVIKQSKGFRGRANRCFRVAIRRLEKSWQYAYRDRKVKKREFRKLWIQRLNAGVRQYDVSYSKFIQMQSKSGVMLDRKILSGLAMYEPFSFKAVVDVVKKIDAELM